MTLLNIKFEPLMIFMRRIHNNYKLFLILLKKQESKGPVVGSDYFNLLELLILTQTQLRVMGDLINSWRRSLSFAAFFFALLSLHLLILVQIIISKIFYLYYPMFGSVMLEINLVIYLFIILFTIMFFQFLWKSFMEKWGFRVKILVLAAKLEHCEFEFKKKYFDLNEGKPV